MPCNIRHSFFGTAEAFGAMQFCLRLSYFSLNRPFVLKPETIYLLVQLALLLHRLFHAHCIYHQLQVAQNLWLFSLDVAFYRRVGQQLGKVAFGHH